jgi:hypothetical protein
MRHRATFFPSRHFAARAFTSALLLALAACLSEPVDWGDVSYRQSQLGDPDTRSAILGADLPSIKGAASPCLRSIRSAGRGSQLFRVWWASRPDSSVVLAFQRSTDAGTTWQPPLVVDSRDRGQRGCDRPAPGFAYDSAYRYLYVAYFLKANDGAGVFFAHSMDNGGMFHAPVPVVYGNEPSAAGVAANGDSVVVAFEDPNARTPSIGIVLSHSTGHIFEARGQATPDDVRAVSPWIALNHRTITVFWKKPVSNTEGQTEAGVGYRVGIWK